MKIGALLSLTCLILIVSFQNCGASTNSISSQLKLSSSDSGPIVKGLSAKLGDSIIYLDKKDPKINNYAGPNDIIFYLEIEQEQPSNTQLYKTIVTNIDAPSESCTTLTPAIHVESKLYRIAGFGCTKLRSNASYSVEIYLADFNTGEAQGEPFTFSFFVKPHPQLYGISAKLDDPVILLKNINIPVINTYPGPNDVIFYLVQDTDTQLYKVKVTNLSDPDENCETLSPPILISEGQYRIAGLGCTVLKNNTQYEVKINFANFDTGESEGESFVFIFKALDPN